ncbi:hypothetical protein EIN_274710 [Entamoeba invadens IP1]|uniref:Uncharacterized protein n=1 Tax=Entamoeba invadens IP1 TaxID=370355 RepID=A0A0A1U1G5_ENTIV|nr:hypothetical protein EIN_274710 [Entamoeba invadens IP1]ELP87884.1 hypothetical protein EIN_274710 [Entamoeba invadens IP1]|eukprot:XP_004254655.1 hypothetical protein EIN_274710 [Entamoeba invadens IP1]
MKRKSPTKDLVGSHIYSEYEDTLYPPFNKKQNLEKSFQETSSFLQPEEKTGIEDVSCLVTETFTRLEEIRELFYNVDRTLNIPPIVLQSQLLYFQIPRLHIDMEDLLKFKVVECYVAGEVEEKGFVYKEDYLSYVAQYYKSSASKRLTDLVSKEGGFEVEKSFTQPEIIELKRLGLLWQKAPQKKIRLLLPRHDLFLENLLLWSKKIFGVINASPFHAMPLDKLFYRYDSACFNTKYILYYLFGTNKIVEFVLVIDVEYYIYHKGLLRMM